MNIYDVLRAISSHLYNSDQLMVMISEIDPSENPGSSTEPVVEVVAASVAQAAPVVDASQPS